MKKIFISLLLVMILCVPVYAADTSYNQELAYNMFTEYMATFPLSFDTYKANYFVILKTENVVVGKYVDTVYFSNKPFYVNAEGRLKPSPNAYYGTMYVDEYMIREGVVSSSGFIGSPTMSHSTSDSPSQLTSYKMVENGVVSNHDVNDDDGTTVFMGPRHPAWAVSEEVARSSLILTGGVGILLISLTLLPTLLKKLFNFL